MDEQRSLYLFLLASLWYIYATIAQSLRMERLAYLFLSIGLLKIAAPQIPLLRLGEERDYCLDLWEEFAHPRKRCLAR